LCRLVVHAPISPCRLIVFEPKITTTGKDWKRPIKSMDTSERYTYNIIAQPFNINRSPSESWLATHA
jgi:hypothetical protein